MKLRSIVKI